MGRGVQVLDGVKLGQDVRVFDGVGVMVIVRVIVGVLVMVAVKILLAVFAVGRLVTGVDFIPGLPVFVSVILITGKDVFSSVGNLGTAVFTFAGEIF